MSDLDHFPQRYGVDSDALDWWLSTHCTEIADSEDTRPAVIDLGHRLLATQSRERLAGMLTVALHRLADGSAGEALVRVTEERDAAQSAANMRAGQLKAARQHRDDARQALERVAAERDEAREEVVRLERDTERLDDLLGEARQQIIRDAKELERLRTIIQELGASEAAEPPPELGRAITEDELIAAQKAGIEEERFRRESLGVWPPEAAYWTEDADGDPGGPFRPEVPNG